MWTAVDSKKAVNVMNQQEAGDMSYILHVTSQETIVRALGNKKVQEVYLAERFS